MPLAFVLDEGKLTDLEKRVAASFDDAQPTFAYSVHMKGDRRSDARSLDDVLRIRNVTRERIERLIIRASTPLDPRGPRDQQRVIEIDFGAEKRTREGSVQTGVVLEVTGESAIWRTRTLSDVALEIDRSKAPHGPPRVALVLILVGSLLLSLLSVLSAVTSPRPQDLQATMWLTGAQINHFAQKAKSSGLTEKDQQEVLAQQLQNVAEARRGRLPTAGQLALIGVPLLLILTVGTTLMSLCYRHVVFLWGDERERQTFRDNSRRVLWTLLLGLAVTPLVARLYLSGLFAAGSP